MSSTWMRMDVDFGCPVITYRLRLRSKLGQQFYAGLGKVAGTGAPGGDNSFHDYDVKAISQYVENFIGDCRPDLRWGLILVTMSFNPIGSWSFMVVHPDLPKVQMGEEKIENLETCPICNKPIPDMLFMACRREEGGEIFAVCSQACADSVTKQ